MASLSVKDLGKRNNFSIFLSRIRFKKEFTLINNGGKVKINPLLLNEVKSINDLNDYKVGQSIMLPVLGGSGVRLSQIYKDAEFSGRTQATTAAEDKEIVEVNKELQKIKDSMGVDYIPLKVGKSTYPVVRCESTPGVPKCDFHFILEGGGYGGHISHKDGTTPRSFQQWSGTSARVERLISEHPETQAFITKLSAMYPDGLPQASSFGRKIKDNKLKYLAVYGRDYGGPYGENNVDVAMQGNLSIKKEGTAYKLVASAHSYKNGDPIVGGYEPIFLAVYKGADRSDYGIKGARITISPLGGRTVKQFI